MANDESNDDTIPPVRKKGLPLWIFRLIKCLLYCCPCDAYVAFPLLCLIIIAALGGLAGFFQRDRYQVVFFALIGFFAVAAMSCWLKWARGNPNVPQKEDVAKISIQDGVDSWPTAPIAPLRGELQARNGFCFKDELGRRMLLRGVNLQGSCKLPYIPEDERATHLPKTQFEDYKNVSFVGRPFPLDKADFHLGRLRCMGFTFLRFLITWEAIEHSGPQQYDQEYLDYLKSMIEKCAKHGISVFVDFHQGVWSRWTGGDGAPHGLSRKWALISPKLMIQQLH